MNFMKFISSGYSVTFRQKILFIAVLGLISASIIYTINAVITEQAIMRDEIVKKAEVVTRLASSIGELPLISKNPELMKKAITSLKNVSEVSFIAFYDKSLHLLMKDGDLLPTPQKHPHYLQMSIIEGKDHFDLCAPVFIVRGKEDIDIFQEADGSKEVKEHIGWVRIGFSKAAMKQAQESMIYKGLLMAVIFTIGSSLFVYKLTAAATKPLTTLSNAVQSISKGKYPEIDISSGDEIGALAAEFNRMSRTIRDREDMLISSVQLSTFVADTGLVLTQSDTLQTILQRCTELMVRHFNASLARIWTYNKEENLLGLSASSGIYTLADSPHTQAAVGRFEAGMIAQTRQPHYSNDIAALNYGDREWAEKNNIRAFAAYPLIVEDHLVGVMEMYANSPLTQDIFDTLDSVANEIALCIQHKLVEWKIKDSLREKEVLLREIHHRVKNNMQVISSLLNFQTRYINDKQFIAILNESQNRIKSMALIHEKLYRSGDLSDIDFKDYISSLAGDLFKFYAIDTDKIALRLDIEDITFEIDTAIPCGLLINELLTNSLKHAFPEGRCGGINISLKKKADAGDFEYELIVSDNGVGIPEDLDISKTKSLGLQLITTLTEHQLQGRLNLDRAEGTNFRINFNEIKYKKRV